MAQQLISSNELYATGVTAGTYANAAYVPIITIDTAGRVSSVTNTAITLTQLNADLNAASKIISYPVFKDYALKINALGNITGATTIDLTLGNYITATVTGTVTWTFSNPPSANAAGFILKLVNGGSQTQNWPTSVTKWPGGSAPSLTASGTDVLVFMTDDTGSTWRGVASMLDSK